MNDRDDSRPQENLGAPMPSDSESLPSLEGVAPARPFSRSRIDFEEALGQLASNAEAIAKHYLPNGKRDHKHWSTGDIWDAPPGADGGSFKLDLIGEHAGKWQDFATGDKGDLLDLIQNREKLKRRSAFDFCKRQGWLSTPPKTRSAAKPAMKSDEAKRARARRIWEDAKPLDTTIGETYLKSRGLAPPYGDTLRFHPNVFGHPTVVAAFADPETRSVAAIQATALKPDGSGKAEIEKKRRFRAAPDGAGVTVQAIPTATEIVIAEGIETALSLREAAPDAEIVAYGPKTNLMKAKIDARFKRVTIAADQDAQDEAIKLADRLRGEGKHVRIAVPAESDTTVAHGYDFNDLLREKGNEAVKERLQLGEFKAPLPIIRCEIGKPIFWDDPDEREPDPLIEGLIDKGSCTIIFGQPNVGKTFVTYAISRYVAAGETLCGRAVEQGAVLYLQFEGHQGLQRRKTALKIGYGDRDLPLVFVKANVNFVTETDAFVWLAKSIESVEGKLGQRIALVVIDTLSASCAGYEENDNGRGALIIQNFKKATTEKGMTLIVVHHPGKDPSRGPRGGTVLRGNFDNVIEVKSGQLVADKMREAEKGDPIHFELKQVIVGRTPKGLDVNSCYATFSAPLCAPTKRPKSATLSRNAEVALRSLQTLEQADEVGRGVSPEEWRTATLKAFVTELGLAEGSLAQTWKRAFDNLMTNRVIEKNPLNQLIRVRDKS